MRAHARGQRQYLVRGAAERIAAHIFEGKRLRNKIVPFKSEPFFVCQGFCRAGIVLYRKIFPHQGLFFTIRGFSAPFRAAFLHPDAMASHPAAGRAAPVFCIAIQFVTCYIGFHKRPSLIHRSNEKRIPCGSAPVRQAATVSGVNHRRAVAALREKASVSLAGVFILPQNEKTLRRAGKRCLSYRENQKSFGRRPSFGRRYHAQADLDYRAGRAKLSFLPACDRRL